MSDAWRRVDQVLQAALLRPPDERDSFLHDACAGDPALEKEVRSLLAADERAGSFLDDPAIHAAARALAGDQRASDSYQSDLLTTRMALSPGSRLGPYEISAQIGRGGMGEVYRARDTNLGRQVAIKVLPEAVAADRDRLARFDREAKTLAALNHPNIAAIYGLERRGGSTALVMELVEGLTLADRIAQGAIPVAEALPIARQIAEALEAAHEQGIIHRDLKPANVKVTPDGRVKVLDFGLAKASVAKQSAEEVGNSPTLSALPTMQGVIMGTAAYMSPEQSRGKTVTRATDIWAFGCVLYEMLTGNQAFPGEDVTDILAAVVRGEPAWSSLPKDTPPAIRTLLQRCLRKNRPERLQDAASLRIEIADVLSGATPTTVEAATAAPRKSRERWAWVAAAVLLIATAALGAWVTALRRPPAEAPSVRFSIGPPEGATFITNPQNPIVSPDGSKLAFLAQASPSKPSQLWVRALDSETARPIAGTDNAYQPFWSADSRFLAFYADGKLKKIAVSGGPAQTLADSTVGSQGTWSRDGVVLFTTADTIYRVSSDGGNATQVTMLDSSRQELRHQWPYLLPDGKHFLFSARSSNPENNAIYVASLDSPQRKLLVNILSNPVYVPPGYLLFNREGTLMARPFDAQRLELTGGEVPIAENVDFNPVNGRAAFSASENGVLGYRTGAGSNSQLRWFDRSGKPLGVLGDPARYSDVQLSPDGKQASVSIVDPTKRTSDIWIFDVESGLKTKFTFDPADDLAMVWKPDGKRAVFSSQRKGHFDLYQKNADGTGTEELLFEDNLNKYPVSFTPDGKFLLYVSTGGPTGSDLFVLSLADRKSVPFVNTSASETPGGFSPDARWIAYVSNESGQNQVYVAPFPGPGGKRLVSSVGAEPGNARWWSHDGSEIFYIARDRTLMVAAVNGKGTSFEVGAVKPLFQPLRVGSRAHIDMQYDVSPDGQRFLIYTASEQTSSAPISVVANWTAALKK
jgi:serine/threonine protein kinase